MEEGLWETRSLDHSRGSVNVEVATTLAWSCAALSVSEWRDLPPRLLLQPLSGPRAICFGAARTSFSPQAYFQLTYCLAILVADVPYFCHATSLDLMQDDQ